jgi:uncharacterized metal-binding protein YceD (DUF177 family)
LDTHQRIIYAFDREMDFEGYDVMYTNPQESQLSILQELYDFIILALPLRKVPPADVHLCAPAVLRLLGLNEQGEAIEEADDTPVDPRWAKLKALKSEKGKSMPDQEV